jgi:hypothetical protein
LDAIVVAEIHPEITSLVEENILKKFNFEMIKKDNDSQGTAVLELVKFSFWALNNLVLCQTAENPNLVSESAIGMLIDILAQGLAFLDNLTGDSGYMCRYVRSALCEGVHLLTGYIMHSEDSQLGSLLGDTRVLDFHAQWLSQPDLLPDDFMTLKLLGSLQRLLDFDVDDLQDEESLLRVLGIPGFFKDK